MNKWGRSGLFCKRGVDWSCVSVSENASPTAAWMFGGGTSLVGFNAVDWLKDVSKNSIPILLLLAFLVGLAAVARR